MRPQKRQNLLFNCEHASFLFFALFFKSVRGHTNSGVRQITHHDSGMCAETLLETKVEGGSEVVVVFCVCTECFIILNTIF